MEKSKETNSHNMRRQWKITSEDDINNVEYGNSQDNESDQTTKNDEVNSYEDNISASNDGSNENINHIVHHQDLSISNESSDQNNDNDNDDGEEEDVDFGMDNYFFSQDFLPERYDRQSQNDFPIKFISSIQIIVNILLFTGFSFLAIQKGIALTNSQAWNITLLTFFYLTLMFWFNYKLHGLLMSISRLFINLEVIKRNDKYYSGVEIPDFFIHSREYPSVTIQILLRDENFDRSTLQQCMIEATRYTDETGAKCNILICDEGFNLLTDEEKQKRISFYSDPNNNNNIGFIARPRPEELHLSRTSMNHQASTLNFAMNFASKYLVAENTVSDVAVPTSTESTPTATTPNSPGAFSKEQYEAYQKHRDHLISRGAFFHGDTGIGDYILLLRPDSSSIRLPDLPLDENGCIKRLVKEMIFDGEQVLYLQCFTTPYVSSSNAEKGVLNQTCNNMYNSYMLLGTAMRMISPLLGSNVLLNKKALIQCAMPSTSLYGDSSSTTTSIPLKQYWKEDCISKDMDLMMRGYNHGYVGRYVTYAGTFQESTSQSYLSEYLKTAKYGCYSIELFYNPITKWMNQGMFSPAIKNLFQSKNVEWYNKLWIISSSLIFLTTIAGIHWALFYNLIFCNVIVKNVPYPLVPVNLMWGSLFLGLVVNTAMNFMFGIRFNVNKWLYFKQTIRETVLNVCLYGSISVRMSIACLTYLVGLSSTSSNDFLQKSSREQLTLCNWIKHTVLESTLYSLYMAAIVIRLLVFTPTAQRSFVGYYGCLPIVCNIALFCVGPLLFDILPSILNNTNKMGQKSLNVDTHRQFAADNNNNQKLSNSVGTKPVEGHLSTDMCPDTVSTEAGSDDGSDYSARDTARAWSVSQSNLPTIQEEGQEAAVV